MKRVEKTALAPLKGIEIVAACGVQDLNAQLELARSA